MSDIENKFDNLTILELEKIDNDVAKLVLNSFKIIQNLGVKWNTGETLENVDKSEYLLSDFFDHLITWYTLSDLSLKTIQEILDKGFVPNDFNIVFENLLKSYVLSNSINESDLIRYLTKQKK